MPQGLALGFQAEQIFLSIINLRRSLSGAKIHTRYKLQFILSFSGADILVCHELSLGNWFLSGAKIHAHLEP